VDTVSRHRKEKIKAYYRDLNVDQALASVRFQQNNIRYTREIFASRPDNVIAIRLTASQKGHVSLQLSLDREKDAVATATNNTLFLRGRLTVPDDKGINQGMSFETSLVPVVKGGKISANGSQIVITNADEVVLLIAQATSYGGQDPQKKCAEWLRAAAKFPYEVLKKRHIQDYQKLYGRVKLNLNNVSAKEALSTPTDQRIQKLKTDSTGDDYLSALQYQYSRYLMISCSRPGDLPANLQGLWNQHLQPAWESDYHTNINLQMNYWFVEAANLAECHEPLITYLDTLAFHGNAPQESITMLMAGWPITPPTCLAIRLL
jgi:alpha-L-fucosidase 2